jgi:hypothetical protein
LLEAAAGEASLVVFRDQSFIGAAFETRLILDGHHVATLKAQMFTKISLVPGNHLLELRSTLFSGGTTRELTVKERQIVFLNAEAVRQNSRTQFKFQEVLEMAGREAIARLPYAKARLHGSSDDAVFMEMREPLQGYGRLYIIRLTHSPEFVFQPLPLLINSKEVARLKVDNYTTLNLRPGNYEISLGGGPGSWKSQAWRGTVDSGRTYVLSIGSMQSASSSAGYIPPPPVGSPAVQGLAGLFAILGASASLSTVDLHYEVLEEEAAKRVLSVSEYTAPRSSVGEEALK